MPKFSVSIFGQTIEYWIYTVSREPIGLPEIQYPVFCHKSKTDVEYTNNAGDDRKFYLVALFNVRFVT